MTPDHPEKVGFLSVLLRYWRAFILFGPRGVADFIKRKIRLLAVDMHYRVAWIKSRRNLEWGVSVIGPINGQGSPSKTLRDLIRGLKNANIPYQTYDTGSSVDIGCRFTYETGNALFDIGKFKVVVGNMDTPLPCMRKLRRFRICFYEYDTGLLDIIFSRLDGSNILAMSPFNYEYFKRVLGDKCEVVQIRYPFYLPDQEMQGVKETRVKFGIDPKAFVVFYTFSLGSYRKNHQGALKAFARAFGNVKDSVLVFKVYNGVQRYCAQIEMMKREAEELGIKDRFIIITDFLPESDIYALMRACDVYLSLHHGEGFGITIAEAMSEGKPVIVTDWSANTEFCTPESSIPIPYEMTPPRQYETDYVIFRGVTRWAEPDVNRAAEELLRCYQDFAYRTQKGAKAKQFINEYFSVENVSKSLRQFVDEAIKE